MHFLRVIPQSHQIIFSNKTYVTKPYHRLKNMDNIVWMDLEMTGLDIEKDKILEVSCLITNKDLNLIAEAPCQCIYQPQDVLTSMDDWCKTHFTKNGLMEDCQKSSINVKAAELNLLNFLKQHIPEKSCPLAGNSIYMDRLFIMKYMPSVNEYLHYRTIDVSSLKEVCKRWNPEVYINAPKKQLAHRSLSDINESIKELMYYRANFLKKQ